MYRAPQGATTYFEEVGPTDPLREAQHLRASAERYLKLAWGTDDRTHDALVMYAGELLERAQEIECAVGADEPMPN
jgi:hypothetical protein